MNDTELRVLLTEAVRNPAPDRVDVAEVLRRGRRRRRARSASIAGSLVVVLAAIGWMVVDRPRDSAAPVTGLGVDQVRAWCDQAFLDGSRLTSPPYSGAGAAVVQCRMDPTESSRRFDVTISASTGSVASLLNDLSRPSQADVGIMCSGVGGYPQYQYVIVRPNNDPIFTRMPADACGAVSPTTESLQQAAFVKIGTFPLTLPDVTPSPTPVPAAVRAEVAKVQRALVAGSTMSCGWQTSTERQVASLPQTDPTRAVYVLRCTGDFVEFGSGVAGNGRHTGSLIFGWTYVSGSGSGLWSETLVEEGASPVYPSVGSGWLPVR